MCGIEATSVGRQLTKNPFICTRVIAGPTIKFYFAYYAAKMKCLTLLSVSAQAANL